MDTVTDVVGQAYSGLSAVLNSPIGRWLAGPIAILVVTGILITLPSVSLRRLAYELRSTPFFAERLARVALARARRRARRDRHEKSIRDLDLALRAITPIEASSGRNRRLFTDALDCRARAYEQLGRWAEAEGDLSRLGDHRPLDSHPSRPEWLRRLSNAKRERGLHADADRLRRQSELLDKMAHVPATAPPILRLWPRIEEIILSDTVDSQELQRATADVAALALRDPSDANTSYARALLALAAGKDDAVALLTRAAGLLPRDFANVYYWRARARSRVSDYLGCLEDSQRAGNLGLPPATTAYLAGWAQFHLNQFARAQESFAALIAVAPANADAHRGAVLARLRLQQWNEVIADADFAIQNSVRDPLVYSARGEAAINLRRFDEAINDASTAIEWGGGAYAYRVRGVAHLQNIDWDAALADLDTAIELEPLPVSHAYRADLHRLRGHLSNAKADADRAVVLDAELPFARLVHGLVALAQWEKTRNPVSLDALDADVEWLITKEQAATNFWLKGLARQARGLRDEALDSITYALTLDATLGVAYQTRGWLRLEQTAWDEAAADFRASLQYLGPMDAAPSAVGLGDCERLQQRVTNSFPYYDAAIARRPGYAPAHVGRGLASAAVWDWKNAVESYSRALRLEPELRDLRRWRGLAYFENGEETEALRDFAAAAHASAPSADLLLDWGRVLIGVGGGGEGGDKMSEAIQRAEAAGHAYSARGWARAVAGEYEEALADCTRAVELAPTVDSLNNRAWVLCKLRRWPQAIADCDQAVEMSAELDYVLKNRSLALWSTGQPVDALRDLDSLVKLRRAAGIAPAKDRTDRMNWLDQANDWEAAMAERKVDDIALLGQGIALWMGERPDAAGRTIRQALALNPNLALASDVLVLIAL